MNQFKEMSKEKWVRWICVIALFILLLVKLPYIVFGALFSSVSIYLVFQLCVWGCAYLKYILAQGMRKEIEYKKWYTKWFRLEEISRLENCAYTKMNIIEGKKNRMKYAAFSLPVFLIMFVLFFPHNTNNSDFEGPAKSTPTIVNTEVTKEEHKEESEEPTEPEATTELEVKDWYISYKNTFNLIGKCTPEAKVDLLPIKGVLVQKIG